MSTLLKCFGIVACGLFLRPATIHAQATDCSECPTNEPTQFESTVQLLNLIYADQLVRQYREQTQPNRYGDFDANNRIQAPRYRRGGSSPYSNLGSGIRPSTIGTVLPDGRYVPVYRLPNFPSVRNTSAVDYRAARYRQAPVQPKVTESGGNEPIAAGGIADAPPPQGIQPRVYVFGR